MPNRPSVADRASFLDAQTQGKNLPRDECKVCVLHISKQKLRAGVEKDDAHDKSETLKSYNVTTEELLPFLTL
jgi:hypothetical protein